jgi:L-amino acid N-acyltransferase YncA
VGEALTREVLARAAAVGAPELLLVVYADNTPALRLYERLGFEVTTVPTLEPVLTAEAARTGRRHVALRARLAGPPAGLEGA